MIKLFYVAAPLILGIVIPISVLSILPTKLGLVVAVISEITSAYFILDESNKRG